MLRALLIVTGLSLTFAITVSVGPYLAGVSHTVGGETKISQGVTVGRFQKWKSWCVWGCSPNSKVENIETYDMSPPELVALSVNRSGGEFTAEVGLQESVSTLDGRAGVTFSATTTLHDKHAIRALRLPVIRSLVPTSLERRIQEYELRNKLSFPTKKPETLRFVPGVGLTKVGYLPTHKLPATAVEPSGKLTNDIRSAIWREEMRKQVAAEMVRQRFLQNLGKPTLNRTSK